MMPSEQRPAQAIGFRKPVVVTALKRVLVAGAVLWVLGVSGSCAKRDRVTTIYGVVTDVNLQPVEGVQILFAGYRTLSLARTDNLKTVLTDKKGEYSVTIEPEKRHSSVHVICQYFVDYKLQAKYESYYPMKNGQHISHCCPAPIGQKTEYNFTLLSR